jgi:hypothetical protein
VSEGEEAYSEMCMAFMELMVSMGLLGSIMDRYPEDVQENFDERVTRYTEWARRQTAEIQEFGESWDE